jgi:transposase
VAPPCCWSLTTYSCGATSMNDGASVLPGLYDEFRVLQVEGVDQDHLRDDRGDRPRWGPAPTCWVISTRIKERPLVRIRDLPARRQRTELWWGKRRPSCGESAC